MIYLKIDNSVFDSFSFNLTASIHAFMFSIDFSMTVMVSCSLIVPLLVMWFVLNGFHIEWSSANPLRVRLSLMISYTVEAYAINKYAP